MHAENGPLVEFGARASRVTRSTHAVHGAHQRPLPQNPSVHSHACCPLSVRLHAACAAHSSVRATHGSSSVHIVRGGDPPTTNPRAHTTQAVEASWSWSYRPAAHGAQAELLTDVSGCKTSYPAAHAAHFRSKRSEGVRISYSRTPHRRTAAQARSATGLGACTGGAQVLTR